MTSKLFATFGARVYVFKIMLWIAGSGTATREVLLGIIQPRPADLFYNFCIYYLQAVLAIHTW
jgi:hypothetical protein